MTTFAPRGTLLLNAIQSARYAPTAPLRRPMSFDQADFVRLFGEELAVTSFQAYRDGADHTVSVFSARDDALAISVEVTQVADHTERMNDRVSRGFDGVSAPLDGLEAVAMRGTDIVLRLSETDTFAVAARGDVFVQVSAGSGFMASKVAQDILQDVFRAK